MVDYKEWRDEDGLTFHHQSRVYFSHCNNRKQMSMHEIFKLTSDIAVEDYRESGVSSQVLTANGLAILCSRIALRFHRMPKENELYELTTWEEKPEALQFYRKYVVKSLETGETLVSGNSSWLAVDLNARRIIPLKLYYTRMADYRGQSPLQIDVDCMNPGKISIPEDMELIGERTIGYSDLDPNGHTNNSRYPAFALDAMSPEDQAREWKDLKLNFSKEAMLGSKLQIFAKKFEEEKKIVVVGKTETDTSFEAEFFW